MIRTSKKVIMQILNVVRDKSLWTRVMKTQTIMRESQMVDSDKEEISSSGTRNKVPFNCCSIYESMDDTYGDYRECMERCNDRK